MPRPSSHRASNGTGTPRRAESSMTIEQNRPMRHSSRLRDFDRLLAANRTRHVLADDIPGIDTYVGHDQTVSVRWRSRTARMTSTAL